jgi:hypothetical protein
MDNIRQAKITRLTMRMLGVYGQMHKVLGSLPVPVLVTPLTMELEPSEMIDCAARAREALPSSPMNNQARAQLRTAVTDWLTATVLIALSAQKEEDARWALPAAALAFDRAAEEFDLAVTILTAEQ